MDATLLATAPLVLLLIGSLAHLWITRSHRDPVSLVTVFIALLFVLNARMVVGPMGAAGSPALLLGIGLAALWVTAKVTPGTGIDRGVQPVRTALFVYAGIMLLSYANAQLRPLTDLEASGSTRALIYLTCLLGVALLVADGVQSRERLDTLLRRLLLAAGLLAAIGALQFLIGFDLAPLLRPPGLSLNGNLVGIGTRAGFNRPWGTSQHAIEFGVVLGALLPLAIHYGMRATTKAQQALQWGLVLLMGAGVAMSLSRSGLVAAGIGLTVLALSWSWRQRLNAAAALTAFTALLWAVIPGLVDTLHNLFLDLGTDPSIMARRQRVPVVFDLIAEHPWLGHGFGTFSVDEYLLVDNEVYVSAISTGWLGVAAFIGLIAFAAMIALDVRRSTPDRPTRHLGHAIAGGLLGLLVCLYTFDAFHYRQFTGVLFLLIGAAGALWRLERTSSRQSQSIPTSQQLTS